MKETAKKRKEAELESNIVFIFGILLPVKSDHVS